MASSTAMIVLPTEEAWACPNYAYNGSIYNFSATQLSSPYAINITAGGNINLSSCVGGWYGYTIERPDVTINYNRNANNRALEFRTLNSGCDTILVVNDANGNWYYDDDSGTGTNARIRLANASGGVYDVWVGTYSSATCSTQLVVETWR